LKSHHAFSAIGLGALLICIAACEMKTPSIDSIRDSKLFDRRITETPRQKIMRECSQEANRFHVSCTHCHTTANAESIHSPDNNALTPVGERAQIMRSSPTFGLNQDCSQCHQTKFALNRNAERLFGPGGAKYSANQSALKVDK
jgi:hypothetical protein